MIKKSHAVLLTLLLSSTLSLAEEKGRWVKGWVWYDDNNATMPSQNLNKTPSNKTQPPETQEKDTQLTQLLQIIIEQNKQSLELQKKLLAIIEEEFDPKPKMIVNSKGEPCVANSSADCFEMPIVAEAQRVPVLAEWIKDPASIEKAKEYLRWQAKFFDAKYKGGYSLNLASKQYGDKAYPIDAVTEEFGTSSGDYLRHRENQMIELLKKHSKNMEIYILLGQTSGFEIEYPHRIFEIFDFTKDQLNIPTKIIMKDTESEAFFNTVMELSNNKFHASKWSEIKKAGGVVVSPKTFETTAPYATPFIVLKYKGDKEFSQVVAVGKDNKGNVLQGIYRTLIINDVIQSVELHGSKADKEIAKEVVDNLNKKKNKQGGK